MQTISCENLASSKLDSDNGEFIDVYKIMFISDKLSVYAKRKYVYHDVIMVMIIKYITRKTESKFSIRSYITLEIHI